MREPTDEEIDQVGKILATAASFDGRTTGTADIIAWWRVIGHLAPGEAEDAVIAHYSQSTDRIMPGHILARVKKLHSERLGAYAEYDQTLPDADPDNVAGYLAAQRAYNYRVATGQLQPRPLHQAIESHFVYVESKWSRGTLAPLKAIEAVPDPEFDAARRVLAASAPAAVQRWLTAAREQLEAADVPLTHRAVAIRAAELATAPVADTATA